MKKLKKLSMYSHCVVLLLCALWLSQSSPARAADDLSQWHFYADTTVLPQADDSFASVYVDFSRLLERDLKQKEAALDENSIRVAPLEDGKPGAPVPCRFVKDDGYNATDNAAGTIVFQVGSTPKPEEATYRVFFDTKKNGSKMAQKNEVEVPDKANMIWNGGFETLSEGYTGSNHFPNLGQNMPQGWWGNLKVYGTPENAATSAHSGQHALAFVSHEEGKNTGLKTVPSPSALRVVPGQNYVFSFWYKGEGLSPSISNINAAVYWYDKDSTYMKHVGISGLPGKALQFDWTKAETNQTAPPDAHFGAVVITTYSTKGLVTIDDLEARLAVPPPLDNAKANQ